MATLLQAKQPDFSCFLSFYEVQFDYQNESYIPYGILLNTQEWQEKRCQIFQQKGNCCHSCGIPYHLQLHHDYYIQGWLPWDYPDDALIPLCRSCHQTFHENYQVVVYEEINGELVSKEKLQKCLRCHGAGYIPQYRHVENGICFRCWGNRYENDLGIDLD